MEARGLNEELRNVYPSAFRAHSSRSAAETPVFSTAERPTSTSAESLTPYVSFPANIGTSSSVTFGCRLVSCYGCKVSQNAVFPSSVVKQNANGQSASKPVDYGWLKEVAFYQSYTGSYPVYFDLPVVHKTMAGDSRHETCLTMEDHPPWKWSNNCSSQLYCSKDQTQSQHFWKPSLTACDFLKQSDFKGFLEFTGPVKCGRLYCLHSFRKLPVYNSHFACTCVYVHILKTVFWIIWTNL